MGNSSKFSVSIGVAVEDKKLNSRQLRVYPREDLPFAGGELKDNTRSETYTTKDENGNDVSGTVKTTNHKVADFFGMGSNQAFPPCVVKGEQVLLIKYEGEDKYYWLPIGRDDNLRRGDLIRTSASNDMAVNKDLTEENTYFSEIDTKVAKRIRLHTSKSDGEKYGYDIVIDAKNGHISIGDDAGNVIFIESESNKVILTNKSGSIIGLDGPNIAIVAKQDLVIKAGGTLHIEKPVIPDPTIRGGVLTASTINGAEINGPTVTGPSCSCC